DIAVAARRVHPVCAGHLQAEHVTVRSRALALRPLPLLRLGVPLAQLGGLPAQPHQVPPAVPAGQIAAGAGVYTPPAVVLQVQPRARIAHCPGFAPARPERVQRPGGPGVDARPDVRATLEQRTALTRDPDPPAG